LFYKEKEMKAKGIKQLSHFVLSPEEKVALVEAKLARTEALVKSLATLAEKQRVARRLKYTPLR
jgi:hypothetical protein